MQEDLEVYRYEPDQAHAPARLEAFATATLESDRWQAVRSWLVAWLALASVPCWVMAAWPGLLPFRVRAVVLGVWVVLVVCYGAAVLKEAVWRSRLERLAVQGAPERVRE